MFLRCACMHWNQNDISAPADARQEPLHSLSHKRALRNQLQPQLQQSLSPDWAPGPESEPSPAWADDETLPIEESVLKGSPSTSKGSPAFQKGSPVGGSNGGSSVSAAASSCKSAVAAAAAAASGSSAAAAAVSTAQMISSCCSDAAGAAAAAAPGSAAAVAAASRGEGCSGSGLTNHSARDAELKCCCLHMRKTTFCVKQPKLTDKRWLCQSCITDVFNVHIGWRFICIH